MGFSYLVSAVAFVLVSAGAFGLQLLVLGYVVAELVLQLLS